MEFSLEQYVTIILILFISVDCYTISCSSSSPCPSTLNCPINENCNVVCTGLGCSFITINCPISSNLCNIECEDSLSLACDGIIIDASNSINGSLIVSAGGYSNIIQNGLIKCAPNGICHITCYHQHACYKLKVIGSYGSVLNLNATIQTAFYDGKIICPDNGECNVFCNGQQACWSAIINATDKSNTNTTLISTGGSSFYNGKIYGSRNGYLHIECIGYQSCMQSTIVSHSNSDYLYIRAEGDGGVLYGSNIYCPDNQYNKAITCSIYTIGAKSISQSIIYAVESFHDIYIHCSKELGVPCISMDNTLTLKCTTYYSQSCLMKLDTNSFDQWNCDTLGPQQCQTFVLQSPAPTTNIPTLNPITVAPTTAIPTTNMPTTLIPTTVTPTTSNPTSLSPTTITPTTMLPTTINPTTSIPTTLIPSSIHPTSNPTKTCLNGIYAVTFTLQFTYDYLIENVSDHAVYNLLVNLSIALIKSETNTIENIISTNYNITLNKIYNLATINIIIYACNKDTINLLAIHIADNLQTDFLLLTNSNTILLIVSDNINILSVSIIDNGNGEIFETSHQLISTTHQIIFNNKYKNDNSSFIMIMIIIGTSIFCCILCIVCYIIFRIKKDHVKYMENNRNIQPHKSTATGYQIDKQISQPQSRQRVQTESIYIEDNDDDKKHNAQIELTDNVTSISVMSNEFKNDNSQMDRKLTTDTDNGMEIYMDDHETNGKETIGNVALRTLQNISSNSLKNIQNQLAAIPHSPIKEVKIFNYDKIKIRSGSMEGQPETKIELNNHGNDVINYDNDNHIEVKNWLEMSCGTSVCEQYFAVFISNGYESLDFITQMNNKSDLKDIGIELKGHQTKIWSEITKLKTTPK